MAVAEDLNEAFFFLWRPIPSPMASAATTATSAKATKPHFASFREICLSTIRSCDCSTLSLLSTLTASGGKVL